MSSSEKSGLIIYSSNHTKPNEHIPKRILETVLGKHGKYDCTKKERAKNTKSSGLKSTPMHTSFSHSNSS